MAFQVHQVHQILYTMRPQKDKTGKVQYRLKPLPVVKDIPVTHSKPLERIALYKSRPTEKQIEFALSLLNRTGYSTKLTMVDFEDFGLPFVVDLDVEGWLASLSQPKIRFLIEQLKTLPFELDLRYPRRAYGSKRKQQ